MCVHGFRPPRCGHLLRRPQRRNAGTSTRRGRTGGAFLLPAAGGPRFEAGGEPPGEGPLASRFLSTSGLSTGERATRVREQAERGRRPRAPTDHADSGRLSPRGSALAVDSVLGPVVARSSPSFLCSLAQRGSLLQDSPSGLKIESLCCFKNREYCTIFSNCRKTAFPLGCYALSSHGDVGVLAASACAL